MTDDSASFFSSIKRALEGDQARSRDTLVPPAFQVLWEVVRFIVLYGGRSAAKSWSIARVLLLLGHESPLRVLCCREIQGSIRESAYRLLADQIVILGLDDFYDIQADRIIGKNGTCFYFEGLRYNASKIRSYEGVDIVWVEEAQSVSELSWETLLPTIRKPGSRFFISFNPMTKDDPVLKRFVDNTPPGAIVKKVSYRDNPHMSPEAEAERAWLEKTDPDAYRHVWEGFPREVSDALILRGKYVAESFEVSPAWAGPYHGLDYGFARDPSAGVRCYIDDATRTLYVDREFWALGADIDALPGSLETSIPGISRHTVYADSARPESTSFIAKNGIPGCRSAEKWPGSVDDGIAYLRSFDRIVIDPSCRHLLDECGSYSFKQDRLTGAPLPEVLDANNHCIDALRYALSPLIRSQPAGGYFDRAAMLVNGEPVGLPPPERPLTIMLTLATDERSGAGVGLIYWAVIPYSTKFNIIALAYDLVELGEALSPDWLARTLSRANELRTACNAADAAVRVHIEESDLLWAIVGAVEAVPHLQALDICQIDSDDLAATIDERAAAVRLAVNGGRVKLARAAYGEQISYRAVTANHFAAQVLGFRPGTDAPHELVNAFCIGAKFVLGAAAVMPVDPEPDEEPALSPEDRAAEEAREAARRAATEQYARDMAEWEAKRDAAIASLRAKFGPAYVPNSLIALGIGRPPPNPNARITFTARN